jgi:multidrug efflux system membrane fusion protein
MGRQMRTQKPMAQQEDTDLQQIASSAAERVEFPNTAPVTVSSSSESSLPSVPKKHRRWAWLIVLTLLALAFTVAFRRWSEGTVTAASARATAGSVPVTTATARIGTLTVNLDAIGTVTPVYTDTITAQVTGVITAVHYREGQFVRKGDPLIDLDSRPYDAQLEQGQGTLQRDQELLAQARMDLARYQQAWAKNGVPRQTLEDQEKLVAQDEGTVEYDEGIVHYDQVQVGYCRITSPITGRVGLRLIDPGNLVTANGTTTIVVITQMQPITVVFTVAEDHLSEVLDQLRHGARIPVEAWDRDKQTKLAVGQVITVDNQIDTTTGTVKLRAIFDNHDGALFPNEFVNARLPIKTVQNQVLIPTSAVQHNAETAFVYVIRNGQAKMTTVTPGETDSGVTAVEGIHPGDVVADSSFEKLQDGSQIAVATAQLSSSANGTSAP